jgi:hypothetical protein
MRKADFIRVMDLANERILNRDSWGCCGALTSAADLRLATYEERVNLKKAFEETMRPHFEVGEDLTCGGQFWLGIVFPANTEAIGYRSLVLGFFKEYCLETKAYRKF